MIGAELQTATVQLATGYGWRVSRFRGGDDGLPDLVLSTDADVLAVTWTQMDLRDGTVAHHLRRQAPLGTPR